MNCNRKGPKGVRGRLRRGGTEGIGREGCARAFVGAAVRQIGLLTSSSLRCACADKQGHTLLRLSSIHPSPSILPGLELCIYSTALGLVYRVRPSYVCLAAIPESFEAPKHKNGPGAEDLGNGQVTAAHTDRYLRHRHSTSPGGRKHRGKPLNSAILPTMAMTTTVFTSVAAFPSIISR